MRGKGGGDYKIDVTQCQSCGELIRWDITAKGRRMPTSLRTGKPHFIDCPHGQLWSRRAPTKAERTIDAGQRRLPI